MRRRNGLRNRRRRRDDRRKRESHGDRGLYEIEGEGDSLAGKETSVDRRVKYQIDISLHR